MNDKHQARTPGRASAALTAAALVVLLTAAGGISTIPAANASLPECGFGARMAYADARVAPLICFDPVGVPPALCPVFDEIFDKYPAIPGESGQAATLSACGRTATIAARYENQTAPMGPQTDLCALLAFILEPPHSAGEGTGVEVTVYENGTVGYEYDFSQYNLQFAPPGSSGSTPAPPYWPEHPEYPPSCPDPGYDPGEGNDDIKIPECALPPIGADGYYDLNQWGENLWWCGEVCETMESICPTITAWHNWVNQVSTAYVDATSTWNSNIFAPHWHFTPEQPIVEDTSGVVVGTLGVVPPSGGNGGGGEAPSAPGGQDSAQCRLATASESPGNWQIHVATTGVVQAPPLMLGGTDTGIIGNAVMISTTPGIKINDKGDVQQLICYDPGIMNYNVPHTDPGPSDAELAEAKRACEMAGWAIAAEAGLTVVAAGAGMLSLGPGGAVAGLTTGAAATIGAIFFAADQCNHYHDLLRDVGHIHCKTDPAPAVIWGGSMEGSNTEDVLPEFEEAGDPGNFYHSTWLALGPIAITADSDGNGYTPQDWPTEWEQDNYKEGHAVCKQKMDDERAKAFAAYKTWGATTGSGTTVLAATVHVDPVTAPVYAALYNTLTPLPGGSMLYSQSTGALIVGCQNQLCPTDVVLSLTACGTTTMTPVQSNSVAYAFSGTPGCTSVSITINGVTVGVALPLKVDGEFKGAGV